MPSPTFADVGIALPPGADGEVDCVCPQCSHMRKKRTNKCLSVNTTDGVWHCFHCGWSGALGLNGSGADARFMPRGVAPAPPRVSVTPPPLPTDPVPAHVVAWFARRGIPASVLIAAGIRWADGTILFPYWREGTLVNVKHRTLDKRFWMVAGARRILYGLDDLLDAQTVCIVEGEIDKLSIDAAGGPPTVSVPDGAPPPDAQHSARKFSFLDATAMARLRAARTVLIGTDMDAPGERLAQELARRIGPARCKRVSWHPSKDANELLVAQGTVAVLDALAGAEPMPPLADGEIPHATRPVRLLPPPRARRSIVELAPVEVSHAG